MNEATAASRGDDSGGDARTLAEGAPRPDDAFDGTEAVSARNRVFRASRRRLPARAPTSTPARWTARPRTSSRGTSSATSSRRGGARSTRAPKPSRRKRRRWRAPPSPATRVCSARTRRPRRAPAERTSPAPRASLGSVFGARGRDTGGDTFVDTNGGARPETRFRRGPRGADRAARDRGRGPPRGGARSAPRSSRHRAEVQVHPRTRRRRSRRGGAVASPWRSPRWWSGRTKRRRPRTATIRF